MKFLKVGEISVDNSLTRCKVCTGFFNVDKEGGIKSTIETVVGILNVSFCVSCLSEVHKMCEQYSAEYTKIPLFSNETNKGENDE
jgi:hypothetical protein